MTLPSGFSPTWVGSRVDADPVTVSHRLAETDAESMQLLMRTPLPTGDFYLDGDRKVAVRFPGYPPAGIRPQLLKTLRAGFTYEIGYDSPGDALQVAREWHRTMLLMALPARRRGILAHAAGFVLPGGAGILCPGVSGTGKSTLASTVLADPRGGVIGLSDDRVAVTVDGESLRLWGTPWHSAAGTSSPDDAGCRAMVFVRHGAGASLSRIAMPTALRLLLRSVAIPFWDSGATSFALEVIDRLLTGVPSFEFAYAPGPAAGRAFVESLMAALATPS